MEKGKPCLALSSCQWGLQRAGGRGEGVLAGGQQQLQKGPRRGLARRGKPGILRLALALRQPRAPTGTVHPVQVSRGDHKPHSLQDPCCGVSRVTSHVASLPPTPCTLPDTCTPDLFLFLSRPKNGKPSRSLGSL